MSYIDQIDVKSPLGLIEWSGWIGADEVWSFDTVDDPTGSFTVYGDVRNKYSAGMRIKFTNNGNTIYGIISKAPTYLLPLTTITFLHEIDPSNSRALHLMVDSDITSNYYSMMKGPQGFPLEPEKWRVFATNTDSGIEPSAVNGTWYNLATFKIDIPIGSWRVSYISNLVVTVASPASYLYLLTALETSSGAISYASHLWEIDFGGSNTQRTGSPRRPSGLITVSEPTSYYLFEQFLSNISTGNLRLNNGTRTWILAECAYL